MLTASGLNFGFRRTVPHVLGVAFGMGLQLLICASLLGHASRLTSVRPALAVIGCSYLLWLAVKLARAGAPDAKAAANLHPMRLHNAMLFQWVNPKAWMIALNASVLFLPPQPAAWATLALALSAVLVCLPCMSAWAWGGERLRRHLQRPWALRAFNISMGGLLAGTALYLLAGELWK